MAKDPFERVFSLIERKKLLRRIAQDNVKTLLKSSGSEVFEFNPLEVDKEGNLEGQIHGPQPKDFTKVTALFYVDNERYFVTTRIKRKDGFWVLYNSATFFKFNRRSAFRIRIPSFVDLSYHVSTVRNIEINQPVSVIEFSSGGARIHWFSDRRVSKGTHIKGVLQWGRGRVLPVEALVVHSPEPGVYGIRFTNLTTVLQNRLKMLSVEIQQAIHFY